MKVLKRNHKEEDYSQEKVADSIFEAAQQISGEDYEMADDMAEQITEFLEEEETEVISAEDLQDLVYKSLVNNGHASTAKVYILYAEEKNRQREMSTQIMKAIEDITFQSPEENNNKRENANIDTSTAMGTMLKYGSESAKTFNLLNLMTSDIRDAHINGDIHIHDLDFYSLTETCDQIPLNRLFKGGFNTGHGFLREPKTIRTAASLAAIAIQCNQNDQHGGQSIPMFDFYLSPYVAKSYVRNIASNIKKNYRLTTEQAKELKHLLYRYVEKTKDYYVSIMDEKHIAKIRSIVNKFLKDNGYKLKNKYTKYAFDDAYEDTKDETYQAMEGFIHNMNTLHSRAGSQVPFSSINYGTDITVEGRMLMFALLKATEAGLGNGEIPLFPIQIMKIKTGVNLEPDDPNYDLFVRSCEVTALRLYPNWVNLDAPYNKAIYVEGNPETEVTAMGCRTRVATNKAHPNLQVVPGRGNLSFTSINLPRLAIRANGDINKFYKLLDEMLMLVHKQLLQRFELQCLKHPRNYPFLMGQGNWLGTENLGPDDDIREALKNGTLTVGFIGLAETLTALIGKHHGESEEAQKLGLEIIQHMRDYTDAWSNDEHMNYSVIGTPAEGLSGRFVAIDKKIYGEIPGVTDKEYYTNSSHVPVSFPITAYKKVEIEAPYHEIENGGHILYIELDGDPTKNINAIIKLVKYMHDKGAGYMAINHPVDRDPICGYVGIINDVCPRCGRKEGEPMTMDMWNKVKGYANVGNADTLGVTGDMYEEMDRISNKLK